MAHQFFTTKSLERILAETKVPQHALKRTLSSLDLTLLGIGCIIGTGIFVLTGVAAAKHAGPAIILSFVLSGMACAFAALCYAEFAAMIPVAGSAYTYAYATLGELFAWIIGWDLILEYAVGAIAVSIGWSGYFVNLLNNIGSTFGCPELIPKALATCPQDGGIINLPAVLIVLVMTWLLIMGIKESANVNSVIVAIKVVVVLFFIVVGLFFIKPGNWQPFIPFGWQGIFAGAAVVFFAYIGFDAVSTTAEEAKNPQRDLPIGIIASLIICTVLYILVAAVMTGLISYPELNVPHPMAKAFDAINLKWASGLVSIGAVAGITSVLLVLMMGQPRIFFAMCRDRLLPRRLAKVHPRYRTPYIATIITGVLVAGIAGFVNIGVAAELCNIGTLFAFVLVCAGVLWLRYHRPEVQRPFKVPLFPVLPIFGILSCLALMLSLPLLTWWRFVIWLVIGLVIYLSYGMRHSSLAPGAKDDDDVEIAPPEEPGV